MGGGAWPFLVGGVICLVNSVNERDLNLLNSYAYHQGRVVASGLWRVRYVDNFLEGQSISLRRRKCEAITGL